MPVEIDALAQRLLLESTAKLVTDTTEPPYLSEDHEIYGQLDAAESEEESQELVVKLVTLEAEIANSQPLIGGPLSGLDQIAECNGEITLPLVYCQPLLHPLKKYCQRILIQHVLNRTHITLLVDSAGLNGLDKQKLNEVGVAIRKEIETALDQPTELAGLDTPRNKKSKKHKKQKLKTWIQFEVVHVADQSARAESLGALGQNTRAALKALKQRSIKNRVLIHGFALNPEDNTAWATNNLTTWRRCRYWQYALRHRNQSIGDIKNELANERPKTISAVVAGGLAAVASMFAEKFALMSFELDQKLLMLMDFIIPSVALLIFHSWQRLNSFASVHAKWFLISYLLVLSTCLLLLLWPPTIGIAIYLGVVGMVAYVVNMAGAIMAEME